MLIVGFTVCFLLSLIYVNYIVSKRAKVIPFLALFVFELIWILVSVVYLEHGAYVSEIGSYSYATGASLRFVIVVLPFLIFAPVLFYRRLNNKSVRLIRISNSSLLINSFWYWISIFIVAYNLLNVILSGNVFTNPNITKGNFYQSYSQLPFAGNLGAAYLKLAVFILGMFAKEKNSSRIRRTSCYSAFIVALLTKIMIGEKFYGLYTIVYNFFLYSIFQWCNRIVKIKGIKFKYIIRAAIVFFVVFWGVYQIGYIHSSKLSYLLAFSRTDNALDALLSRALALQGHTWWGIDRITAQESGIITALFGSFNQILIEIKAALTNVSVYDENIGLVRIMRLVAPSTIVDNYIANNSRFYGGYWTVFTSVFGYFGTAVLGFFVAYLFSIVYHTLYEAMKSNNKFSASICLLYALTFYEFFRIGNLSLLLGVRGAVCLLLIILMNCGTRKRMY